MKGAPPLERKAKMATEKAKKPAAPKIYNRVYDDKGGKAEVTEGDETVASIELAKIPQAVKDKAVARYLLDIVVGTGGAARKAEGGTPATAQAKMKETVEAFYAGTFTFRSASGSVTLGLDDEMRVIAETLVSMNKAPDVATALEKVQKLHAKVKIAANGNETRPDYNALRNIPKIKAALDNATPQSDTDEKLGNLGFEDVKAEGDTAESTEPAATEGQPQ